MEDQRDKGSRKPENLLLYIKVWLDTGAEFVELQSLGRRLNAIGLQPIPGDQFGIDNLSKDDKDKIKDERTILTVVSRQFNFEETNSVLQIHVK